MPDTVTPLLKFTKPDVGGSTNTWGDKLNIDLDSIDGIFLDMGGTATTGSSTAYVFDPHNLASPTLPDGDLELKVGLFVRVRIHETNSNISPTFKFGDLAAKPIKKQLAGKFVDPAIGDLPTNYIAEFLYHTIIPGGGWVFLNPMPDNVGTYNQLCQHRNLAVEQTGNKTIQVRADSVVLGSENRGYKLYNPAGGISHTANIHAGGAGGLGTGSDTEAVNTWYTIYLIGKDDGTIDAMFAIADGGAGPSGGLHTAAPTLPTGYTFYGFVGTARTDGSKNLVDFYQVGNMVSIRGVLPINIPKADKDFHNINLQRYCPPEAVAVRVSVAIEPQVTVGLGAAGITMEARLAPVSPGEDVSGLGEIRLVGYQAFCSEATVVLKAPNQISARHNNLPAEVKTFELFVNGYWL